ncbi:hypothetical protein ACKC9G_00035 [Pokkaliibacter sp. CJK22405]|uniref:hypothetical protein n=1 Tax=Pokkaliibacter sp. CJK22405 TaxID=3384615 RepID=UPI003984624B
MTQEFVVQLVTQGSRQTLILPDECKFDAENVYLVQDPQSGCLVISDQPNSPTMQRLVTLARENAVQVDAEQDGISMFSTQKDA